MHSENDESVLSDVVETEDEPRAANEPLSPEGDAQGLSDLHDELLDEEDDEDEEDVILNAAMLELGPASDEESEVNETTTDGGDTSDSSNEPKAQSETGASEAETPAEKPKPVKRKKKTKEAVPPAPLARRDSERN